MPKLKLNKAENAVMESKGWSGYFRDFHGKSLVPEEGFEPAQRINCE